MGLIMGQGCAWLYSDLRRTGRRLPGSQRWARTPRLLPRSCRVERPGCARQRAAERAPADEIGRRPFSRPHRVHRAVSCVQCRPRRLDSVTQEGAPARGTPGRSQKMCRSAEVSARPPPLGYPREREGEAGPVPPPGPPFLPFAAGPGARCPRLTAFGSGPPLCPGASERAVRVSLETPSRGPLRSSQRKF